MSDTSKKLILLAVVIVGFVALFFIEPFSQKLAYHNFVDTRPIFGVKNSFDVLSNLAFIFAGIMGFVYMRRYPIKTARASWYVCFVGVFTVGFASAYYHDTPNNVTLIPDRLTLTIGFMGIFSAILTTYVSKSWEKWLLPLSVGFGAFSVLYWGRVDDLRFYYYVQGMPLVVIALVIAMFKTEEIKRSYLGLGLGCYLLAKIFEFSDGRIFEITGSMVSGHTLKHLFAGLAPVVLAMMFKALHKERAREFGDELEASLA